MPIVTRIRRLIKCSLKEMRKTWVLYSLPIPLAGSRIAFPLDMQLEIAHVVRYYTKLSTIIYKMRTGYNTPKVDVTGCVSSVECVICEISKSKITSCKRPITNKILTIMPLWASQVDCKDTTFFLQRKNIRIIFSLKKRQKTH